MNKTLMRYGTFVILLFCCGCTSPAAQQEAWQDLRADVAQLQETVSKNNARMDAQQISDAKSKLELAEHLSAIDLSLAELSAKVAEKETSTPSPSCKKCEKVAPPIVLDAEGKLLLGEIERIWVDPPGLMMLARIDTGASSSSLHADNITPFERDGDDWVRFDITNAEQSKTVELPVNKYVRVFQQADKKGTRRPVVDMRLFIGNVKDTFSFTLADRSHLEHDMILGRNFLTDMALVDVSRQHVQPDYSPDENSE